jgi:hypothetical protein
LTAYVNLIIEIYLLFQNHDILEYRGDGREQGTRSAMNIDHLTLFYMKVLPVDSIKYIYKVRKYIVDKSKSHALPESADGIAGLAAKQQYFSEHDP